MKLIILFFYVLLVFLALSKVSLNFISYRIVFGYIHNNKAILLSLVSLRSFVIILLLMVHYYIYIDKLFFSGFGMYAYTAGSGAIWSVFVIF
jgi:hypothetical protein